MVLGSNNRRVLVTGGGTFLGDQIATALIAEGADVTLLMRPGTENRLPGALVGRVRWLPADMWDAASLRGRARNHICVIHTVGSLNDDPVQGLSYHRLNFVSARNIINMCVGDGVPHVILMSAARAPWLNAQYLAAKREAEDYVRRVGMSATVIRAPLTFQRGSRRPIFFEFVSALRLVPPFSLFGMRRIAPIPIDLLARATARIALMPKRDKTIYYAPDLRRLNSREETRRGMLTLPSDDTPQPTRVFQTTADEEAPFGWTPPRR